MTDDNVVGLDQAIVIMVAGLDKRELYRGYCKHRQLARAFKHRNAMDDDLALARQHQQHAEIYYEELLSRRVHQRAYFEQFVRAQAVTDRRRQFRLITHEDNDDA